jgi:hypothetical protein
MQRVTVLNTVGNCNTMVSIIILQPYGTTVVDRNVVMRRIPSLTRARNATRRDAVRRLSQGVFCFQNIVFRVHADL